MSHRYSAFRAVWAGSTALAAAAAFSIAVPATAQDSETAEATEDFGTHGAFGKRLDVFDERVTGINIDTGIAVTEGRGIQGLLAFC